MLCSDGLWANIENERMGAVLESGLPLQEAIDNLVREAEQRAIPDSDNISAICLRWREQIAPTNAKKKPKVSPTNLQDELTQAIDDLKLAIKGFETKHKQEKK